MTDTLCFCKWRVVQSVAQISSLMWISSNLCVICCLSQWSASVCVCFGVYPACPVCFVSLQAADKDTVPTQLVSACLSPTSASAASGVRLPSSSLFSSSSVHPRFSSGTCPRVQSTTDPSPLRHLTFLLLLFPYYTITELWLPFPAPFTLCCSSHPFNTFHLFCWYKNSKYHIVRQ